MAFHRQLELKIRTDLREFLEIRGWLVIIMVGNRFQSGVPDLYCFHPVYKERWIDTKVAGRYEFTKAQIKKWPIWSAHGVGIWIITEATDDEYKKLFESPNWKKYWKSKYGDVPDIDKLLGEIEL